MTGTSTSGPEDGALTLAEPFTTDLIRANLTENSAEPFEFVPSLFNRVGTSLHTEKLAQLVACVKQ